MAVAAVPRMEASVQSSPVVATAATSDPDYFRAWFWLWFQPTQPPWIPAPVLSAILQPPINSQLPKILPIIPFQFELTSGGFWSFATQEPWRAQRRGRRASQRFHWERRIFIPLSCREASQIWIPRGSANDFVSTTENAQSGQQGCLQAAAQTEPCPEECWELWKSESSPCSLFGNSTSYCNHM